MKPLASFLPTALLAGCLSAAPAGKVDWPIYLGGKERNLYSPLRQIHRGNVKRLKVVWMYDTGESAEYQANNLIIDGVLYTPTQSRRVVALDAATGRELWTAGICSLRFQAMPAEPSRDIHD